MTGFPSLLKDCLQQCHYPLLPMYTLHELENDVFEKEFYAKVFVPAKTSPQGWFFVRSPMPTTDLAIQQVAYEALLRSSRPPSRNERRTCHPLPSWQERIWSSDSSDDFPRRRGSNPQVPDLFRQRRRLPSTPPYQSISQGSPRSPFTSAPPLPREEEGG